MKDGRIQMQEEKLVHMEKIENKKISKVVIYGICILLVTGYFLILGISVHPKTSIMYYLSYIGDVERLKAPENRETLEEYLACSEVEYQMNRVEKFTFSELPENRYDRIAKGWGVPSEEGIWCSEDGGYFFYKIENLDRKKDITMNMDLFLSEGYKDIDVTANGIEVGKIELKSKKCNITIPAEDLVDEYLIIGMKPEKENEYNGDLSLCLSSAALCQ